MVIIIILSEFSSTNVWPDLLEVNLRKAISHHSCHGHGNLTTEVGGPAEMELRKGYRFQAGRSPENLDRAALGAILGRIKSGNEMFFLRGPRSI